MIAIVGAEVYESEAGKFSPANLVIRGERIARLVPREAAHSRPRDDRSDAVIDATGLYLLPGLIDCHVHLTTRGEDADPAANAGRSDVEIRSYAAAAAERTVMGGITTVRDVGGWNYVEVEVRNEVEAGRSLGPTLVLAGRLLSMPTPAVRYYPGMYEVARGEAEMQAAARRQLDRGADHIKVMATGAMLSPEEEDAAEVQFTRDEIRAAVETAEDTGRPVAAHAHALEGIRNAVDAGVASIEHGTYADDEVLVRMADDGVFLVPTIAASASMMRDERVMNEIPPHLRIRLVESHRIHVEMVNNAWRAGVPIAMGTDAGTPGNHHGDNADECVYMVEEAGMTPAEAIRAATINGAHLIRRSSDMGSLEPGKFADVIGCSSNPLQDITALRDIAFVMRQGNVIENRRKRKGEWHDQTGMGESESSSLREPLQGDRRGDHPLPRRG
jgi:imidazolonepropionase-like amidohydrolase